LYNLVNFAAASSASKEVGSEIVEWEWNWNGNGNGNENGYV